MKKIIVMVLLACGSAQGEWYRVNSVTNYNTITAAKADGENDPITIRIRNLEKIEYIQPDSAKVLIGGKEAISLAKRVLQGQLVWVENLKPEEGAYVADVYPSFEQVVTAYKESRLLSGDNVSADLLEKIKAIYKQMLIDLNHSPLTMATESEAQQTAAQARTKIHNIFRQILSELRSNTIAIRDKDSEVTAYENEFLRTLFTADAIIWYRDNGQYMHPAAQMLFADLLQNYQNDPAQTARYTQIRIEQMMEKEALFKELFLDASNYARGQFTYTCLDWFKNRGQYLHGDAQNMFINWLRIYQVTNSTDSEFMKQRLQWMIENNGLYQDFLDLGK